MLSRLRDARVFTDSSDVVIADASARSARRRLLDADAVDYEEEEDDDEDDAQSAFLASRHPPSDRLHPQHPYNAQLLRPPPSTGGNVQTRRPMEFVYLPSGEIRPRDECPPGLALPPPADDEAEEEEDESDSPRPHRRPRRRLLIDGGEQRSRAVGASSSRKSRSARAPPSSEEADDGQSDASLSLRNPPPAQASASARRTAADASSSSEEEEEEAQSSGAESDDDDDGEKENARYQPSREQPAAAGKKPPTQTNATKRTAAAASSSSALQATSSRRREPPSRRDAAAAAAAASRAAKPQANGHATHRRTPLASPSSASDAEWPQRPTAAAAYEDLLQHPRRPKTANKSTKMDVRDLLSEHPRVRAAPPGSAEQQLQREKQRVLDKMTQLLAEQSKNQQLQQQLSALQTQLAAAERDADVRATAARQAERASLAQSETHWRARVQALEEQLRSQDAAGARLQSAAAARQATAQTRERDSAAQLDKLLAKLRKFHARVQSWRASSQAALDACDASAAAAGLLEAVWLDFPAFPLLEVLGESVGDGDGANMVAFLKKRLRVREDELRRTHAKYVELKELCARQCVREVDLQNFINEHRLRGNLVIRKDEPRKNVQFQEQQAAAQAADSRRKAGGGRVASNAPAAYDDDDEDEEDGRVYDDEDTDGADAQQQEEVEEDEGVYVRQPKVFVQVSRDGVYEHNPRSAVLRKLDEELGSRRRAKPEVERIRLVPSPTRARRFERVPAASEVRRKPSGVTTPTRATARLARAPPSISATRSSSVAAARRKPSSTAAGPRARPASVASRLAPWV